MKHNVIIVFIISIHLYAADYSLPPQFNFQRIELEELFRKERFRNKELDTFLTNSCLLEKLFRRGNNQAIHSTHQFIQTEAAEHFNIKISCEHAIDDPRTKTTVDTLTLVGKIMSILYRTLD